MTIIFQESSARLNWTCINLFKCLKLPFMEIFATKCNPCNSRNFCNCASAFFHKWNVFFQWKHWISYKLWNIFDNMKFVFARHRILFVWVTERKMQQINMNNKHCDVNMNLSICKLCYTCRTVNFWIRSTWFPPTQWKYISYRGNRTIDVFK